MRLQRTSSLLLTASIALFVGGCAGTDDVVTSLAPLSEDGTAGDAADLQATLATPDHPAAGPMAVDPRQRGYLDALTAAGIRRTSELAALAIGSYVCQGRAAGQSDQAVWDFVFPLVRGDVDHLEASMTAHDATAGYLRAATERLC